MLGSGDRPPGGLGVLQRRPRPLQEHQPRGRREVCLLTLGEFPRGRTRGVEPDEGLHRSFGGLAHDQHGAAQFGRAYEGGRLQPAAQRLFPRTQIGAGEQDAGIQQDGAA